MIIEQQLTNQPSGDWLLVTWWMLLLLQHTRLLSVHWPAAYIHFGLSHLNLWINSWMWHQNISCKYFCGKQPVKHPKFLFGESVWLLESSGSASSTIRTQWCVVLCSNRHKVCYFNHRIWHHTCCTRMQRHHDRAICCGHAHTHTLYHIWSLQLMHMLVCSCVICDVYGSKEHRLDSFPFTLVNKVFSQTYIYIYIWK